MKHHSERRAFLKTAGAVALGAPLLPLFADEVLAELKALSHSRPTMSAEESAQDEAYWATVRKAFPMSPDFINLENGYFSPASQPVIDRQVENIRMINGITSLYMRRRQVDERVAARKLLAEFAGCSPDELVICRNTTEALDTVISGLHMERGDEAIMTDQDYGSMLAAFAQRSRRYGTVNTIISLPLHPANDEEIVGAYERAITPRTKVLLATHMINLTGQILPVRKIAAMAHARGIDVIADSAHSFAHVDFTIPDLDCDYFGTSLHKWLCAPLGTGMLYVKKEKIKNVWPLFGDDEFPEDDIRKFEHIGTHPCSSVITIEKAIAFHNAIGPKRKEARLRFLKDYWVEKVSGLPKFRLNTPMEPARSCAIANFAVEGKSPDEIVNSLYDRHNVFTVAINTAAVKGVRVTPHLYNTLDDLDVLVRAIRELCTA